MTRLPKLIALGFIAVGAFSCCPHRPPPQMVINVRCETDRRDHEGPRMFHHGPGGPGGHGMHGMRGMGGHDRGEGPMGPPYDVAPKNIEQAIEEANADRKRACAHGLSPEHPDYETHQQPCNNVNARLAALMAQKAASHAEPIEIPKVSPPPKGRPHK